MNLAGAWNCSNFVYLDSFGAIRVTAFNIHINFAHAVICMRNSAVLLVINCCLLTAFTRALSDEQSATSVKINYYSRIARYFPLKSCIVESWWTQGKDSSRAKNVQSDTIFFSFLL